MSYLVRSMNPPWLTLRPRLPLRDLFPARQSEQELEGLNWITSRPPILPPTTFPSHPMDSHCSENKIRALLSDLASDLIPLASSPPTSWPRRLFLSVPVHTTPVPSVLEALPADACA